METLPGIASVLRSPVADAFVGVIRAAARLGNFAIEDAEEILRFAVRRNLMVQEETDRVLAEIRTVIDRRAERAAERESARKAAPRKAAGRPLAKAHHRPKAKPPARGKSKSASSHKTTGKHGRRH
jgi:hypothetical protein